MVNASTRDLDALAELCETRHEQSQKQYTELKEDLREHRAETLDNFKELRRLLWAAVGALLFLVANGAYDWIANSRHFGHG